ncbi:MAG: hypothetical protein IPK66_16810 [Rhodospirillales bacterium]|nr:hypothetical protein [Rhodospirillales bacterium]
MSLRADGGTAMLPPRCRGGTGRLRQSFDFVVGKLGKREDRLRPVGSVVPLMREQQAAHCLEADR